MFRYIELSTLRKLILFKKLIASGIKVVRGAIASFVMKRAGKAISVLDSIEPIQDLHGYEKPWSGGNGANKWDEEWEQGIISWTGINSDDGSTRIRSKNFIPCVAGNEYRIVTSANLQFFYYDSNKAFVSYEESSKGNGSTITIPTGVSYFRFYTYPTSYGATYHNDIAINNPSSVTAYSPYTNICPISGHTEVVTSRCGVNLLDVSNLNIGKNYTGETNNARAVATFRVPTGTYTASIQDVGTLTEITVGRSKVAYPISTLSGTVKLGVLTNSNKSREIPIDAEYPYIYVFMQKTGGITLEDCQSCRLQLELGSTATDYHAYNGTSYTTDLGRTVYGGTLDVVSGVLTVDRAMVDLGSLNWKYESSVSNPHFRESMVFLNCKYQGELISTMFVRNPQHMVWNTIANGEMCIDNSVATPILRIKDDEYTDATAFETAVTGQILVYELATPQTYQLTPQEVELLLGQNNLWCDAGEIEVTYKG